MFAVQGGLAHIYALALKIAKEIACTSSLTHGHIDGTDETKTQIQAQPATDAQISLRCLSVVYRLIAYFLHSGVRDDPHISLMVTGLVDDAQLVPTVLQTLSYSIQPPAAVSVSAGADEKGGGPGAGGRIHGDGEATRDVEEKVQSLIHIYIRLHIFAYLLTDAPMSGMCVYKYEL